MMSEEKIASNEETTGDKKNAVVVKREFVNMGFWWNQQNPSTFSSLSEKHKLLSRKGWQDRMNTLKLVQCLMQPGETLISNTFQPLYLKSCDIEHSRDNELNTNIMEHHYPGGYVKTKNIKVESEVDLPMDEPLTELCGRQIVFTNQRIIIADSSYVEILFSPNKEPDIVESGISYSNDQLNSSMLPPDVRRPKVMSTLTNLPGAFEVGWKNLLKRNTKNSANGGPSANLPLIMGSATDGTQTTIEYSYFRSFPLSGVVDARLDFVTATRTSDSNNLDGRDIRNLCGVLRDALCDTLIRVPKSKGIDGCLLDPRGRCRVCFRYRHVWIRVIIPFLLWFTCLLLLLINNTTNGVKDAKRYQKTPNCINYKGQKKNDFGCRCGFVDCQQKNMFCAAAASTCCASDKQKDCKKAYDNNKGPIKTYPWSKNCINNKGKNSKDCDTPIAPAPSSSIFPQIKKDAPSNTQLCALVLVLLLTARAFWQWVRRRFCCQRRILLIDSKVESKRQVHIRTIDQGSLILDISNCHPADEITDALNGLVAASLPFTAIGEDTYKKLKHCYKGLNKIEKDAKLLQEHADELIAEIKDLVSVAAFDSHGYGKHHKTARRIMERRYNTKKITEKFEARARKREDAKEWLKICMVKYKSYPHAMGSEASSMSQTERGEAHEDFDEKKKEEEDDDDEEEKPDSCLKKTCDCLLRCFCYCFCYRCAQCCCPKVLKAKKKEDPKKEEE